MNGIIPAFFIQFTKRLSFYFITYALFIKPIVEQNPFISNVSFMLTGIPNNGGKYFYESNYKPFYPFYMVQFYFFDYFLT
jgi:hypothetical protein